MQERYSASSETTSQRASIGQELSDRFRICENQLPHVVTLFAL